jgi:hypothetical protein
MSISSIWILHRRVARRSERAAHKEPVWSRWYVPLLAAGLVLLAVTAASIAALEIVTATPRPPTSPATPRILERGSDVDWVGAER